MLNIKNFVQFINENVAQPGSSADEWCGGDFVDCKSPNPQVKEIASKIAIACNCFGNGMLGSTLTDWDEEDFTAAMKSIQSKQIYNGVRDLAKCYISKAGSNEANASDEANAINQKVKTKPSTDVLAEVMRGVFKFNSSYNGVDKIIQKFSDDPAALA